jgi:quercetin dioxygenase-like cupin family protein
MSDPFVVAAGRGRTLRGPTGMPMTVKIAGADTGGAYSLIEYSHEAGAPGPPAHVHHCHEEIFHVLEGELTLAVDGRTLTLGPGDFAVVPRGTVHRASNRGATLVRFFFISSPAMDGFFTEMARLNASSGGRPAPDELAELGARWDSEFTTLPTEDPVPMAIENCL